MWTEGEAQLRAREKEERGKKGGRDLGKEGVRKEGEGGGGATQPTSSLSRGYPYPCQVANSDPV